MTQKKSGSASSNAEVVSVLPRKEKVDLLAQALLREYMHRRGFRKTLATFDTENPRTGNTISSRQLMSDLMALTKIQERAKRAVAGGEVVGPGAATTTTTTTNAPPPLATFMEMLCSYRLRKRALQASRSKPVPNATSTVAEEDRDREEASDSSADEWKDLQRIAERRRMIREREAACARETEALEQRVTQLRQTLAELRQKEARLAKRVATAAAEAGETTAESPGKQHTKKKKGKSATTVVASDNDQNTDLPRFGRSSGDDAGPDDAAVSEKPVSQKKKAKDALKNAMELVSALPTTSTSGSTPRGGVGRNWTPGGSTAAIPEVGVGGSGSGLGGGPAAVSEKPPNFVAGDGFHLMADRRLGASTGPPPRLSAEKEKPPRGPPSSSFPTTFGTASGGASSSGSRVIPSNLRDNSVGRASDGSDDEVPSPYRLGKTVYDHRLTAPSILANRSDNGKESTISDGGGEAVNWLKPSADGTPSGVAPRGGVVAPTEDSSVSAPAGVGFTGVTMSSSRKARRVTILE